MFLCPFLHPHPAHLASLAEDGGHVGPDQDPPARPLDDGDDVEGDLAAAAYRVARPASHEVPVESGLHHERRLGGRTAEVAPAVHKHGLQVLVAGQVRHHVQQGPGVLWLEQVGEEPQDPGGQSNPHHPEWQQLQGSMDGAGLGGRLQQMEIFVDGFMLLWKLFLQMSHPRLHTGFD